MSSIFRCFYKFFLENYENYAYNRRVKMNKYKELRKRMGLTQKELADKIHVDQSTVSKWEQDKAVPDIQTLSLLSSFFNVSIDFLLGKNNPLHEPPTNSKTNTIVIYGRGQGKTEYEVTEKELKAIKTLLETMKDLPDEDNF